ncbi:hypothetical protein COW20_09345, partial [bacterium (Candidatus Blackallbacteria) CG13_big_fil_rev_8_21_14_2_50_49_14]
PVSKNLNRTPNLVIQGAKNFHSELLHRILLSNLKNALRIPIPLRGHCARMGIGSVTNLLYLRNGLKQPINAYATDA